MLRDSIFIKLFTVVFIIFSVSVFAEANIARCDSIIFNCNLPDGSIKVCRAEKGFSIIDRNNNEETILFFDASQYEKTSYHRALVNEHRLILGRNNFEYIFSYYENEEIIEKTAQLSVSIENDKLVKNNICEKLSISRLAELDDTNENPIY